jgi:hypothetical protein
MNYLLNNHGAGGLRVWSEPKKALSYVVGADVATDKLKDIGMIKNDRAAMMKAQTEAPDFSCAIVVEKETGRHVATWHGRQGITTYAETLAAVSLYYNQALLIVERNAVGEGVLDSLYRQIEYPNLYVSKLWNVSNPNQVGTRLGWFTNESSRAFLIQRIEDWLQGAPKTFDGDLVKELRTMQRDQNGVPRARGRNKDDRVMALGIALQGRYELLFGGIGNEPPPSPDAHLSAYEKQVWSRGLGNDRDGSNRGVGFGRRGILRGGRMGRRRRY